jgi:hypothetical protein
VHADLLEKHWRAIRLPEGYRDWKLWRTIRPATAPTPGRWTYKLYLSPRNAVREAFAEALAVATELQAPAMKIGSSVPFARRLGGRRTRESKKLHLPLHLRPQRGPLHR